MDPKEITKVSQSLSHSSGAGSLKNTNTAPCMADTSYDTYQRASACLRKLREDITLFRDPKVRNHFNVLSVQESLSPGLSLPLSNGDNDSEVVAKQHAAIVSLRTTIAELESSLSELKTSDLNTRKRAARAEGQLVELRTQQKAQERAHQAAVDEAATRIRVLESDSVSISKAVADERARLSQRIEELQLEVKDANKALGSAETNALSATTRLHAVEAELRASKANYDVERRMLQNEKRDAHERENVMRKEVEQIRSLRRSSLQGDNQSVESQKHLMERIQLENLQLKSELQWLSSKAVRTERELHEAEHTSQSLRDQLFVATNNASEVERLRKKITELQLLEGDAADAKKDVDKLRREKEEIRKILSMLSRSGDVTEGLAILKKIVQNDHTAFKEMSTWKSLDSSDRMTTELILENSEVSDKKGLAVQGEVVTRENETKRLTSESANVKICEVLEKEIEFLKMAVDESKDRSSGKPVPNSTEAATFEKMMMESRNLLDEYRELIGSLKAAIHSKEEENKQLKTEICSRPRFGDNPGLVEITKGSDGDLAAFTQKISFLEAEIKELRSKQEGNGDQEGREGDPDYDSKLFKVVHMSENPLTSAIFHWKQEQEKMKGKKRMRVSASPLKEVAAKEEMEVVRSEMTKMKEEYDVLKRKAVLGDRTRQVALKRIEEVRCAVYNLFGWSMKVNGAIYALSSIYAESPMEVLHFCVNEEGGMSLVDSEYAQGLSQELEQYVEKMNSFPALLSHITMANFEKTTAFMS